MNITKDKIVLVNIQIPLTKGSMYCFVSLDMVVDSWWSGLWALLIEGFERLPKTVTRSLDDDRTIATVVLSGERRDVLVKYMSSADTEVLKNHRALARAVALLLRAPTFEVLYFSKVEGTGN